MSAQTLRAATIDPVNALLTLDEPVSETITEWKDDPRRSAITIAELLHLTSGLEAGHYSAAPTYEEAIAAPLVHPQVYGVCSGLRQRDALR